MSTAAAIQPNSDQQEALDKAASWMSSPLSNTFSLGGLAGTGKSTLIPLILDLAREHGLQTRIATPTGKAASVVNKKLGRKLATTIHSLAYTPVGSVKTDRRDYLNRELEEPVFHEASFAADLLIVDESSMVDRYTYDRLVKTGCLLFFVGDHGQLPPVREDVSPSLRHLNHELTEIVRQAEDSPIRRLAYDVRNGHTIEGRAPQYPGIKLHPTRHLKTVAQLAVETNADLVICATNKVRNYLNETIQELKGFDAETLSVGETIILLSNSHPHEVFNGEMFELTDILGRESHKEGPIYTVNLTDGERTIKGLEIGFRWRPQEAVREKIVAAELGYALTTHKAQGSQGDNVVVVAENISWMDKHAARHRYTSVTRAAKDLTVAYFKE